MSLNILKPVHSEAEIDYRTNVDGEWKIEIVCPNGEIKKPFGDKWRKNLIQDRFLNFLNGTDGTNSRALEHRTDTLGYIQRTEGLNLVFMSILNCAYFGGGINSTNDPFATNKTFLTSSNANIWWTRKRTPADADNTSPTDVDDDMITVGSRTQKASWDFGAVGSGQTVEVQEILIARNQRPETNTVVEQINGSQTTFTTVGVPVVSRFVLPEKITLTEFQFLRLRYRLKVTIPAIVNPVTINLTNNGFDAYGRLKLLGSWNAIFNNNTSAFINGQTVTQLGSFLTIGASTRNMSPEVPWSLIDRNGVGAAFLKGNANSTANFSFPNVNTDLAFFGDVWLTNGNGVTNLTPGGSKTSFGANDSSVIGGSISSEATLLFPASNPSDGNPNGPIAGIVIYPGSTMDGGFTPFGASSGATAGTYGLAGKAWYWQFTDATFTNKVTRYKDPNYGLAINLRQTVSRG